MTVEDVVPIFIVTHDLLAPLKHTLEGIEKNVKTPHQIVIHDTCSTYKPLLIFLKELEESKQVIVKRAPLNDIRTLTHTIEQYFTEQGKRTYYVVTDPDIVLSESDGTILTVCQSVLENIPHVTKVGPSLIIDNLPEWYSRKELVLRNERLYYNQPLSSVSKDSKEIKAFMAPIDSTFAMYRPEYKWEFAGSNYYSGIRLASPFDAKHLGWYVNLQEPDDEYAYYIEHASAVSSNVDGLRHGR